MSSSTLSRHDTAGGGPTSPSRARPARTAPAAEPPPVAGRYRYERRSDSWWWSPELYALLGLSPEVGEPCTESLLRAQHPEDRARTLAAFTAACAEGRPFSIETRSADTVGRPRALVLVGEPQLGPDGTVSAVEGLCADVTDSRPGWAAAPADERISALATEVDQLRAAMASRACIEQAKGILMLLTNCGDQPAFDLLAHISSHTHRKVREVATALTESAAGHAPLPADIRAILQDACPPARSVR